MVKDADKIDIVEKVADNVQKHSITDNFLNQNSESKENLLEEQETEISCGCTTSITTRL